MVKSKNEFIHQCMVYIAVFCGREVRARPTQCVARNVKFSRHF